MVHKHQLDVEDTKHVNRVTDKVIKKSENQEIKFIMLSLILNYIIKCMST